MTPVDVDTGIVLGEWEGQLLVYRGPGHVMLFAPPRAGKGVSCVNPTLLSLGGSVIVNDIKGELWRDTAGWRSQFSYCIYYNPTDLQSQRWNALLEVRKGQNEVRDMSNIADMIVDPEGSNDKRDHWEKTSHALLQGAGLHVLYAEPDKSLAGLTMFLSDPKRTLLETLLAMLCTCHLGTKPHPVIASIARECLNRDLKEMSSVLSSALSYLSLYRDPIVARATNRSDFCIRDLVYGQHPMSLYVVTPPGDLSRTRPLVRMMLNMIGRVLSEELAPETRWPLRWIVDECPQLGHMDFFETNLAYMPGYGMQALLVGQSLSQFDQIYGKDNVLMSLCDVRMTYGVNDDHTANRLVALLDKATVDYEQQSTSGKRLSLFLAHTSRNKIRLGRALMTVGELTQLPQDEGLVLKQHTPPLRLKKIMVCSNPRLCDPRFVHTIRPAPALALQDLPPKAAANVWAQEGPKPVLTRQHQRLLAGMKQLSIGRSV